MVPVPGVFLGALARDNQRDQDRHAGLPADAHLAAQDDRGDLHARSPEQRPARGRRRPRRVAVRAQLPQDRVRRFRATSSSTPIKCILAGLTAGETFSYEGKHFTYKDVPIALRPLQQPHPAFWYGSSNTTGSTWAGEQGLHFATQRPDQARRGEPRHLQGCASQARRPGPAEGRVPRRDGDRRAAPDRRRRHRRGGAPHRQAGRPSSI